MINKENLETVLRSFTGSDSLRPVMMKPHADTDHYFATDAHCLVMIPKHYDLNIEPVERFPNCYAVIPKDDVRHEPITYSVKELIDKCNEVTADVPMTMDCSYCEGQGSQECDLGHDHDCEECNGEGEYTVQPIKMVKNLQAKYEVLGGLMGREVLFKMLNACQYLGIETINKVSGKEYKAYLFEAKDITFLLMPLVGYDEDKFLKVNVNPIQ